MNVIEKGLGDGGPDKALSESTTLNQNANTTTKLSENQKENLINAKTYAHPKRINTCLTVKPLGEYLNPILKRDQIKNFSVSVSEYPIETLLTEDVRAGNKTGLDIIESYLERQVQALESYSQKPDVNKETIVRRAQEIQKVEQAIKDLRKNRVEAWIYINSLIKSFERENGAVDLVRLNIPLRTDSTRVLTVDMVNGKCILWE